ncbi:MAG: glycerol-3-phosphate acyltransferase [Acidobacteriota bacterium]|nr:glycerol-3-phosphate acyltransferase [Acidobacteriota bacterium]
MRRAGDGRRFGALRALAFAGLACAAGSIPTGRLVTRALTGRRLEDLGDGKAGSSNVAHSVGWRAGAVVLALDALKAYAPAAAARLAGAGDGAVAAVGISAVEGHIVFVKGRGAASALGAAFAMDPAMMAVGCIPLVGGSLLRRHAQAVAVTALALPFISLALHRSPRRALGPLVLVTALFAARLAGSGGAPFPSSRTVLWNRFWLDRDER